MLDFQLLAAKQGWRIERQIFVSGDQKVTFWPNLLAEMAVFQVAA